MINIKGLYKNDYFFSVLAKIVNAILIFSLSIIYARYFGTVYKGVWAILENNIALYAILFGLGIYQSYPFFKKKEPDIGITFINNVITLFMIYFSISIFFAFSLWYWGEEKVVVLVILLVPIAVLIRQFNYIVLVDNPRRRKKNSLYISISRMIVVLFFVLVYQVSVKVVGVIFILSMLGDLVLSFYNLKIPIRCIRLDASRIWEFAKFGVIPMLVILAVNINYKVAVVLLRQVGDVLYRDIGIYAMGVSLSNQIMFVPDALKDVLLSRLVGYNAIEEVNKVIRVSIFAVLILLLIMLPASFYLIPILYGLQFKSSFYIMVIIAQGCIPMIFFKTIYAYNIVNGKRMVNLIFLSITSLFNIIACTLIIPYYGIWGASFVTVFVYILLGLLFLTYYHYTTRVSLIDILFVKKKDLSLLVMKK